MTRERGRTVALSPARRVICDLLDAGVGLPLVPFEKTINLADVAEARLDAQPRPSWCSIFTKAYATVVAARPALRRVFLTFPWQRMYESQQTTADVAVQARLHGEDVLVFVTMRAPHLQSLQSLDRVIHEGRSNPQERADRFRRACRLTPLPRLVRRAIWWSLLNVSGRKRSRYFGTFGVSSVSNWGVDSLRPIAPCTTVLHYGTLQPNGDVAIRVTFDHRVMDGGEIAAAMVDLERVLRKDMLFELLSLQPIRRTAFAMAC